MSEDDRKYSDREFALILAKASELARSSGGADAMPSDFSLADMKKMAAEVGLDPTLIERAVRLTLLDPAGSRLERIVGGRATYRLRGHVGTQLTEAKAAQMLNAVKAAAEQHGEGESSSAGVSWHTVGKRSPILVSAHTDGAGTDIRVTHDRRAGMVATATVSTLGSLAAGLIVLVGAESIGIQSLPLGLSMIGGTMASVLAVGRAVWASGSRRSFERVVALMEAASRSLEESTTSPASRSTDTPRKPA